VTEFCPECGAVAKIYGFELTCTRCGLVVDDHSVGFTDEYTGFTEEGVKVKKPTGKYVKEAYRIISKDRKYGHKSQREKDDAFIAQARTTYPDAQIQLEIDAAYTEYKKGRCLGYGVETLVSAVLYNHTLISYDSTPLPGWVLEAGKGHYEKVKETGVLQAVTVDDLIDDLAYRMVELRPYKADVRRMLGGMKIPRGDLKNLVAAAYAYASKGKIAGKKIFNFAGTSGGHARTVYRYIEENVKTEKLNL